MSTVSEAAALRGRLSLNSTALSASLWSEPETFKPDRFIDTDDYKWNRDAFIPFSAGARSCVGQKFSQVEIVCELYCRLPFK